MKLNSQVTQRFERRELQRLRRLARPPHSFPALRWAALGLLVGAVLVLLYRLP